jgi:hypothetical protein
LLELQIVCEQHGGFMPGQRGGKAVRERHESFSLTNAAPNVPRCGAFPENIELTFSGSGVDTEGRAFNVTASDCTNTTTNEIFDLKVTDQYVPQRTECAGARLVRRSVHALKLDRAIFCGGLERKFQAPFLCDKFSAPDHLVVGPGANKQ